MAGSVYGTVQLKVTPDQLKVKSDEVTMQIKKMTQSFDELSRIVSRTSRYWVGEAGELHRRLYEEDKDDIEEMIKRLKEHPRDLLTMANVYIETEARVKEISEELPDDIIS